MGKSDKCPVIIFTVELAHAAAQPNNPKTDQGFIPMNENNKVAILGGTGPQEKKLLICYCWCAVGGFADSVRAAEVAELNAALPQGSANRGEWKI